MFKWLKKTQTTKLEDQLKELKASYDVALDEIIQLRRSLADYDDLQLRNQHQREEIRELRARLERTRNGTD